jgi:SAM-dependent methyltransferase
MIPAKQFSACPLCGNSTVRELYRFEPARFIPGQVVRCVNCGCIYKKPSQNAKPIGDYYRDPRYHDLDYWSFEGQAERALRQVLDTVLSVLGHAGSRSLLEVGCGPGQFLKMAQEAGFDVSGVDLNSSHATEAGERTGAKVICRLSAPSFL